jgi:hypothetical protein
VPLTDAADAAWSVVRLQRFRDALEGYLDARDALARAESAPVSESPEAGSRPPLYAALERVTGSSTRLRARREFPQARDELLLATPVAMQIMRQVLPWMPDPRTDGPDGPDLNEVRDLRLHIDLAVSAIGLLNDFGELDRRIAEPGPRMAASALHKVVWSAAERLWSDGHHSQAVQAAASAVNAHVQSLVQRRDVADADLMQQVFSSSPPEARRPRLRWPGSDLDLHVRTMNDGLRQFAPGVFKAIRNPASHGRVQLDEQEALEQLACLSTLMRWLTTCRVITVSESEGAE